MSSLLQIHTIEEVIASKKFNVPILISEKQILDGLISKSNHLSAKYPGYFFLDLINCNNNYYYVIITDNSAEFNKSKITKLEEYKKNNAENKQITIKTLDKLRQDKKTCHILSQNNNMGNYHYIYFDTTKELSEAENRYIITNFILKYSYPSCMNIKFQLTEREKSAIIENEFAFMTAMLIHHNPNLILIQVPSTIYSLYNIYTQYNLKLVNNVNINIIRINKLNYESYCTLISETYDIFISTMIEINFGLMKIIYEIYIKNQGINWIEIMNYIIDNIYIFTNFLYILNKESSLNYAFTLFIPNNIKDLRFNIKRNYILLITNLELELKNNGSDIMYLYRGSFLPIEEPCNNKPYSISYNTSLLNGILNDIGACTYWYYNKDNYKYYYIIKKHFYNDKSIESKLFWIPPIHPILLLNLSGELFHARSKIPSEFKNNKSISGLHLSEYSYLPDYLHIPDYLLSDLKCKEIHKLYLEYITQSDKRVELIDKAFNKYLKYKTKYIELKNKINI